MGKLFEEASSTGETFVPWVCPNVEEVIETMNAAAEGADPRQLQVMHVFLNIALFSVDSRLGKNWKKNMTHTDFFGDTYKFEMGLACLLLEHFSQQGNILYNMGLTDEDGNILNEIKAPKTKKRKKMQTSKNSLKLEDSYYRMVEKIEAEMERPGFKERMAAWDKKVCDVCPKRVGAASDDDDAITAPKINIAPVEFLTTRDAPELSAAGNFLRRTGIFGAFQAMDGEGNSSVSTSSTSANSTPQSTHPLTQQNMTAAI